MKPIKFKHQNVVFGEGQEEYQPLPALKLTDKGQTVVTCWKLLFWERCRVMFTGKVWKAQMTFGSALQPSLLATKRKELYVHNSDYTSKFMKFLLG